jgi:hypothetical protein
MKSQTRSALVVLALVLMMGLATAGVSFAQNPPAPAPQAVPPQGQAAGGPPQQAGPRPPAPGEDKPFDDVVKDMKVIKGLFTFYWKEDDNKLLMEIQPDQFDTIFLFAATVDRTVGENGLFTSQVDATAPFYFQRVGKTIRLMEKNTRFFAKPGTPEGRSTERSFTDSLIGSAKIASKPHTERKSILIDASELLLSDLPLWAPILNQIYAPTNYRFDKANSSLGPVKAFPENVLLDVWLHYATDNPRRPSLTLPDSRSIPIAMKYEISALKDTGYKPRLGDDRVGYFLTFRQDYSSNVPGGEDVYYVRRWHLEKQNPGSALSPPKEPITFWLENTIPVEYRDAFREGVLVWNKAFERIGFKDAVVVKQQPDDADWDPADTRYNTIRWFHGVGASFAIGPSRANPFTGQIYDADIGFSDGIIRFSRRAGQEFVYPVAHDHNVPVDARVLPMPFGRRPDANCTYATDLVEQAAFGLDLLEIRGAMSPEAEKEFVRQYILEVTAHEVGHTLGLRHNFRASTLLKFDQLHDTSITWKMGQSGSVMDYNPIVLAGKGQKQGDYVPLTLGPYDNWVIEYGYKPIAGDEPAELAKIAGRVAEHGNAYSTDEDAQGGSTTSIDPRAFLFDQSDDPIAYNKHRIGIINELWANAEAKLVKPGEGYQVLRRAVGRGLGEYNRSLSIVGRVVGGIYHHRDHAGDPNGRVPYTPVPAAKQREALDFLRVHAFGEKAFVLPAGLQNKLAVERMPQLTTAPTLRIDYPWHDQVIGLQAGVLGRLYSAPVLKRVQDNELLFAAGERPFTMADLFSGLDSAIWSELGTPGAKVSAIRRNLQREQVRLLTRLVLRPAPPIPIPPPPGFIPPPMPPHDATTLARASLLSLQSKIRQALPGVTDRTTRAHLEETPRRRRLPAGAAALCAIRV